MMAQFLLQRGQIAQAKLFAQRALAGGSGQSFARVVMAKIFLAEDKTAMAIPELEKAAPDDVDGSWHYVLYRTLHKLGRDKEAQIALEKSRELLNNKH
jgi:predicted Zn-dependent protease